MPREKIFSFGARPVVLTQKSKQALAQHDIAVLIPFARADMDAHPGAVDIAYREGAHLRDPEPCRIGCGNDGLVLDRADLRKDGRTSSGLKMTGRVFGLLGWEISFTASARLRVTE